VSEATRRILLAEDDRFLRRAAESRLRQGGFTVLPAVDGEEALRLARTELPDLILLDLIMPKVQGFEVLKALKADATTRNIPVVVLSNLGQESDVQQAMAQGAAAYFVKAKLSLQGLAQKVGDVFAGGTGWRCRSPTKSSGPWSSTSSRSSTRRSSTPSGEWRPGSGSRSSAPSSSAGACRSGSSSCGSPRRGASRTST
jgi:CheY-like chemotaxis protein